MITRQRRNWIIAGTGVLAAAGITLAVWPTGGYQPRSLPRVAPTAASPAPSKVTPPPAATIARSAPVRLTIPSIGVNAPVEPLGVCPTSDPTESCSGVVGNGLATPAPHFANMAGWWSGGFTPGQNGTSLIVGHINYASVGNEVFAHLDQLATDFSNGHHDQVTTTLADGATQTWTVSAAAEPDKYNNNAYWTAFWHNVTVPGSPTLILATCGGTLGAQGHYLSNIIITLTLSSPALAGADGPIS